MSNTMDATELLKMFKDMVDMSYRTTENVVQRQEYETLYYILDDASFVMRCITDDFPLNHAPSHVYLFDLEREVFWKNNDKGYTRDIYNAGLFGLEDAKEKVNNDLENKTKIVYFGE